MANDEFNNGARHGFNMALYAVRNVDKNIKSPETHGELGEIPWQEQETIYNAQKDVLYKIYESIKKQMKEEVHEE
jgi:hypothetical protein